MALAGRVGRSRHILASLWGAGEQYISASGSMLPTSETFSVLRNTQTRASMLPTPEAFSFLRNTQIRALSGLDPTRPVLDSSSSTSDVTVPPSGGLRANPGRPGSSREEESAPYVGEPWTYTLTEIPPDTTASRLSDKTKEAMYAKHKEDPLTWTAAALAKEYRIREQRAHAILWLKELEKKAEEEQGGPLDDTVAKYFEEQYGVVDKAAREEHVMIYPRHEVDAIEDEDERMEKLLEDSKREEVFKVEEFVRRMNFNKLQMSGELKVNPIDRKRPKEGWSYVVEELGEEGRRGKSGGRRYVVAPDGTKRGLNEVEKQFLEREKVVPRRRIVR